MQRTALAPASRSLQTTPLGGGFGIRIHDTPLAAIRDDADLAAAIRELVARHRVVVITDPTPDPDPNDFVGFAATQGRVRPSRILDTSLPAPARDHLFVGRRPPPPGVVLPASADAGHGWHVDYTQAHPAPLLSMLYAVQVPPSAVVTGFADMAAVYQALPQPLRDEIADLQALHYRHPTGVDLPVPGQDIAIPWAERQRGVPHPLVQTNAAGLPALFLPHHRDSAVQGRDETGSRALLDALWAQVEAHGRAWSFTQASHEILVWDNRTLLHRRDPLPTHTPRLTWFLTTQ